MNRLALVPALLGTAFVVAACIAGSDDMIPEASTHVTTIASSGEYDELVAVVESNGSFGDWRSPVGRTITPAATHEVLIELDWTEFVAAPPAGEDGASAIGRIRYFGVCDESCKSQVSTEALALIHNDPPPAIQRGVCANCTVADNRSILEFDGEALRGLAPNELFDAFFPVDTDYEITLMFDDVEFVMNTGAGWHVVTVFAADEHCFPTDLLYRLWSLDNAGARTQLAMLDAPAGRDPEVCS